MCLLLPLLFRFRLGSPLLFRHSLCLREHEWSQYDAHGWVGKEANEKDPNGYGDFDCNLCVLVATTKLESNCFGLLSQNTSHNTCLVKLAFFVWLFKCIQSHEPLHYEIQYRLNVCSATAPLEVVKTRQAKIFETLFTPVFNVIKLWNPLMNMYHTKCKQGR